MRSVSGIVAAWSSCLRRMNPVANGQDFKQSGRITGSVLQDVTALAGGRRLSRVDLTELLGFAFGRRSVRS